MNKPTSGKKKVLASVKALLTNTILPVNFYTSTRMIFEIMITFDYYIRIWI